jgi:hypothetical protein
VELFGILFDALSDPAFRTALLVVVLYVVWVDHERVEQLWVAYQREKGRREALREMERNDVSDTEIS